MTNINLKSIRLPRLRLAMEHNNKEFATHIHCQQVLRQEWYANVTWLRKSVMCKCAYVIYLLLLTPLFIGQWSYTQVGKDIVYLRKLRKEPFPKDEEIKTKSRVKRYYFKYLKHCKDAKNRFAILFLRVLYTN